MASIYFLPLVDSGNEPKISVANLSHGTPTNISPGGTLGLQGGNLILVNSTHLATQFLQSSHMPLQ